MENLFQCSVRTLHLVHIMTAVICRLVLQTCQFLQLLNVLIGGFHFPDVHNPAGVGTVIIGCLPRIFRIP